MVARGLDLGDELADLRRRLEDWRRPPIGRARAAGRLDLGLPLLEDGLGLDEVEPGRQDALPGPAGTAPSSRPEAAGLRRLSPRPRAARRARAPARRRSPCRPAPSIRPASPAPGPAARQIARQVAGSASGSCCRPTPWRFSGRLATTALTSRARPRSARSSSARPGSGRSPGWSRCSRSFPELALGVGRELHQGQAGDRRVVDGGDQDVRAPDQVDLGPRGTCPGSARARRPGRTGRPFSGSTRIVGIAL